MSTSDGPLYLGFDLSTQQLKGKCPLFPALFWFTNIVSSLAIVITSSLKVEYEAKVDFDADLGQKYGIKKGVFVNDSEHEVNAPVAMWLEAIDLVLSRLQEKEAPFHRIKGISGAGQQHGSVYWSKSGEEMLGNLDPSERLVEELAGKAFSHPLSPNWQDASTQGECDAFDGLLLGESEELARVTGSKAHHVSFRFWALLLSFYPWCVAQPCLFF